MSVTVDANVLLYASDEASPFHRQALELVAELARGPELVYLFWPTAMAYLRIATHPAIFGSPLPLSEAAANIDRLLALPHVQTAGEQPRFWSRFQALAVDADARGNLVPDTHIVALMSENGVRAIWTHDRDYRRFPSIEIRDPFAG
ncbi:MAG: TA system VapC family ribonuclease toxin [Gaiellaceae bacterium]